MITSQEWGTRKIYWTDSEKEWQDLVTRGAIVYTVRETTLFTQHPSVLDDAFRAFLLKAKMSDPSAMLLGVERL